MRKLLPGGTAGRIQSIAVLPLENFSRDVEQEYFADGMTEELITQIAQNQIAARDLADLGDGIQGSKKKTSEIGRELNVEAVLEGSVQRSGPRVRVTAPADPRLHG